jgi:MFS family permease
VVGEQSVNGDWAGHTRGSADYGRLLAALACAGIATFAQLYSPQAVLPLISSDLDVGAASAALVISASTVGLAIGVIPWSALADRGTWASSRAGAEVARFGRKRVLLASVSIMMVGVAITLSTNVIAVLVGLVVATAGFFGAHSTAAGWTSQSAPVGKAQASSLYNLFYYGGSSAIGWLGGVAFDAYGWTAVAATILACAGVAAVLAGLFLFEKVGG